MGLLRIVVQKPEGAPMTGLAVTLRRAETGTPSAALVGESKTDNEGVVRFSVTPGTYQVHMDRLPEGTQPPQYGTTVRFDDFAEGMEQIIRLVRKG